MPAPRLVPLIRSQPAQLVVPAVPKLGAPPVFVGELSVSGIRPGSTLTITTENHIYTINMSEPAKGMLMTNNNAVPNGLVILHGSWDLEMGEPCWGALQRGMGLLFAHLPNVQSATKTSTIQRISLTRKGT